MLKKLKGKRYIAPVAGLAAVIILASAIIVSGCGGATTTVTEAGSTTVQPVAEKLANAYMAEHPDIKIIIQGGGSSTGIKSCNDGTVDIGAASRELKSNEPALITHLLARDGIAIVTQASNPVSGLTTEQVKDIFAGNITNWSEVGGDDHAIVVVAREEGSGTRTAFEELVMKGALISGDAILQPSNGAIKTTISTTPYSIGFLSLGYVDTSVKALAIDGVIATEGNAQNGTYPIIRPLYFLTKEQPTGAVEDFIDFCRSSAGQDIVEDEGYLRID